MTQPTSPTSSAAGVAWNLHDLYTGLDDAQKQALILAAVVNDKQYDVLQASKITLASGQRGSIQLTDSLFFLTGLNVSTVNGQTYYSPDNKPYEIGFRSTVCPTVSADRQFVNLDLHVRRTTLRDVNVPPSRRSLVAFGVCQSSEALFHCTMCSGLDQYAHTFAAGA